MKKFGIIFLMIVLLFSYAFSLDKGIPVYQGGKTLGGTRTYGIDPCGAQIFIFNESVSGNVDMLNIAVTCACETNQGGWITDVGTQLEENIVHNQPLILFMVKETEAGSPDRKGYYAIGTLYHITGLGGSFEDPEIYPDVTLNQIPIPSASVSGTEVTIEWDPAVISGGDVPITLGYNIFRSENPSLLGQKLNVSLISATTYVDQECELGFDYFYSIQIMTSHGFGTAWWLPGPDGQPGYASVDDNLIFGPDECSEYGTSGSDDVFKIVSSAPSNLVRLNDSEPPNPVEALTATASDEVVYLAWDSTQSPDAAGYRIYRDGEIIDTIGRENIYVDSGLTNDQEYEYRVRAYDASNNLSEPAGPVYATPVKILIAGDVTRIHLFPEWSMDGTKIAWIKMDDSSNVSIYFRSSDGLGPTVELTPDKNVVHFSQYTWAHDNEFIYFTGIAGDLTRQIYKASVGSPGNIEVVTSGSGNYYDPSYVLYGADDMLACSIDGDIWTFDPTKSFLLDDNLIPITNFNPDPLNNPMSTFPKLFQPKWFDDGNLLVFVVRWPCLSNIAAKTDIYVINNAQQVILDIKNDIATPINSFADPRLKNVTFSSSLSSFNYAWSPSGSPDGTMVSYSKDYNEGFNNVTFQTDPGAQLAAADFDAYKYELDIGEFKAGNPPKYTSYNESFVKWSPAGGDKFVYIEKNASGYEVKTFIDPTIYGFSGGEARKAVKFEFVNGVFTLSDRSFASISIPENYARTLGTVSIWPILRAPEMKNANVIPLGEYRRFLAGGENRILSQGATIRMHYVKSALGDYEEKHIYAFRYDNINKEWNFIGGALNPDDDGDPLNNNRDGGYVTFNTKQLGTFGLFIIDNNITKQTSANNKHRVYPNPFRPSKTTGGTVEIGVVFDKLPDDITEIDIYTIAGEKVASLGSDYLKYYKIYPELTMPYTGDPYTYSEHGSVAIWKVKNSSGKRVSSGIYLAVFKSESGKNERRKIAVIW